MKSIRLLPVVIFAAAALLVFKGIGLVTQGGYVLVGTTVAEAAGGGHGGSGGGEGGGGEPGAENMLVEHSVSDGSPTLDDGSPTLALSPEPEAGGGGHGGGGGEGEVAAGGEGEAPVAGHGGDAGVEVAAGETACAPAEGAAEGGEAGAHGGGGGEAEVACAPEVPTTASGDAIPMMQNAQGELVPVSDQTGSEAALVERLGERRTQLDERENDIATQMALIEAAEKRLNEKAALLEKLQQQIDGLVDQNKSSDEEQFKGLIATYEAMKPKDAATILNELDLNTLLRVAKGIQPRKMAPIMAKMDPKKAKDLTAALAMAPAEPTVAVTESDIAALPQIVGQ